MGFISDIFAGGITGVLQSAGQLARDIKEIATGEASPEKKAELQQKAMELEFAVGKIQTDINLEEAKHPNLFVAGWRPAVGWICASALGFNYILSPLILWGCKLWGRSEIMPPILDMGELLTLLIGMLGLGVLRTVEKSQGIVGTH